MLKSNNAADYGYIAPLKSHDLLSSISYACRKMLLKQWQPTEPSILAACEDPETLLTYIEDSTGRVFPLPQTNQMWLEYQLLNIINNGGIAHGLYCTTESYRDEKTQKMRHPNRVINKRFLMFEFEHRGDFEQLLKSFEIILKECGVYEHHMQRVKYSEACEHLGKDPKSYILTDADEVWLNEHISPVVLLTHFPERTSPFWNMKLKDGNALKCDIIIGGMECAGGAERSTDKAQQLSRFHSLPGYADLLYSTFGKDRVIDELNYYFDLLTPQSIRSGAGIGMSRLSVGLQRYKEQTGV